MEGTTGGSAGAALEQCRAAMTTALEQLRAVRDILWQASGDQLGPVLSEVDALGQACDAGRVAVVAEAVQRGEVPGGPRGATLAQWVLAHAPSLSGGGLSTVTSLATAFEKAANAPVAVAVRDGSLPLRSAAAVVSEADKLRPLLAEGAELPVLEGLITMAAQHGPRGCRMVRPMLLARHGADGVLQAEQDVAKRFVSLSQPMDAGVGVFEYRLALDVESKTVLEAALGPLSAPRPSDIERDLRPAEQRRGDALVELVRRAVAAGGTSPGVPGTPKATLVVTVDHDVLVGGLTGAGAALGGPDAGTLLAPETVRRIACDAALIPVVLGGDGEVLDWGRQKRLFTPGQVRRLWLRDGGCTWPGCTIPAAWADAHHLVHWADGGPSNLDNAALLCGRHHTVVHQGRHAGVVEDDRVEWDRVRGSYDQLLAQRASQEPA